MAPLATGVRTLPISVLDPEIGDSIQLAIGLTTTSSQPTSLAACTFSGSQTTAQTITSATTALNFNPTVNVTANGSYYAWVFVYVNGQLYGIVPVGGTLTIGTVVISTGGWF